MTNLFLCYLIVVTWPCWFMLFFAFVPYIHRPLSGFLKVSLQWTCLSLATLVSLQKRDHLCSKVVHHLKIPQCHWQDVAWPHLCRTDSHWAVSLTHFSSCIFSCFSILQRIILEKLHQSQKSVIRSELNMFWSLLWPNTTHQLSATPHFCFKYRKLQYDFTVIHCSVVTHGALSLKWCYY